MSTLSDSVAGFRGDRLPLFFYGTAWKEDDTYRQTSLALQNGFRAIDTANQRKHYHEAEVGRAISDAIKNQLVRREDLFLQTKFTFQRGQDRRLPYDPGASIETQVRQSFESSLEHLNAKFVDAYLLHGPTQRIGLTVEDWSVWQTMEEIHDSGRVGCLGVSNVTAEQLETLCRHARVRPRFVQNRCYAAHGWDRKVREFCKSEGLNYQGFSLLTGNPDVVNSTEVSKMAKRYGWTASQIVFRFAIDVGMIPLTGTSNAVHMQQDLEVFQYHLEPEDVFQMERIAQ